MYQTGRVASSPLLHYTADQISAPLPASSIFPWVVGLSVSSHWRTELELIQSHMAQKPVLRGEVGCACVAREVSAEPLVHHALDPQRTAAEKSSR